MFAKTCITMQKFSVVMVYNSFYTWPDIKYAFFIFYFQVVQLILDRCDFENANEGLLLSISKGKMTSETQN